MKKPKKPLRGGIVDSCKVPHKLNEAVESREKAFFKLVV
jgi:hypothetical protein